MLKWYNIFIIMAILSIQSHVVYGHAGNSSAVFPLQRLGHEVWAINTVEFSNHTGYGAWRGEVLNASLVDTLMQGLDERGVLGNCEAVLSGYLGDPEIGRAIIKAVKKVKAANSKAVYCCDPVMGDIGRGFYVHNDIPAIFKNEVIPLADIVTPNQFELEALCGVDTSTLAGARDAIRLLHKAGPRIVLVTSYNEKDETTEPSGAMQAARSTGKVSEKRITMLMSDARGGDEQIWRISTPWLPIPGILAGSGDLTAAVFLSHYLKTSDAKKTLQLTTGSIYGILEKTFNEKSSEILIIAGQGELEHPCNVFIAEKLFQ
jgi:pyridoxine kinase